MSAQDTKARDGWLAVSVNTKEIVARCRDVASVQEELASRSAEDRTHWHHVAVAEVLKLAAAELERLSSDGLQKLVYDLSDALTDEGPDWSQTGLGSLRRRVANALPPSMAEGWLDQYRDAPLVSA